MQQVPVAWTQTQCYPHRYFSPALPASPSLHLIVDADHQQSSAALVLLSLYSRQYCHEEAVLLVVCSVDWSVLT